MVAATEEGGGSDGGRERDKRVTRGAAKRGFAFVFTFAWLEWSETLVAGAERERERERERGKSYKGVGKKKGVRKIETLNKPYSSLWLQV